MSVTASCQHCGREIELVKDPEGDYWAHIPDEEDPDGLARCSPSTGMALTAEPY